MAVTTPFSPAIPAANPESGVTMHADGHFLHKGQGDCRYAGPLEAAPFPPHATTAEAVESMHRDGYVVFPETLSRDEVRELRAYIDSQGGDDAQYDMPKWCFNKHVGARFHEMAPLLALTDRNPVLATMRGILGDDCQCIGGSMWVTGPGRSMGLHSDYLPISLPQEMIADPRVIVPIFVSTAHYYLDDLTIDMGPTMLVPGSHRAGRIPNGETSWNGEQPKAAVFPAGSCMMFRSDLWHGAALNTTEKRRYMIQVHYANVYIQRQTPTVAMKERWSEECLAALTPTQRELFGEPQKLGRGSYIAPEMHAFVHPVGRPV
jgi:hypothetical protein